jgi:drug/metabolite transporter (DMT)-like permease
MIDRLRIPAAFLVLCLIWSLTYVVLKVALVEAPPLTFTALRALIAGVALALIAIVREGWPRDRRVHTAAFVLGLLNVAALWGFMNLSLTYIGAGETAILTYTQPLIVAALAWWMLDEQLPRRRVLGLAIGFTGVVLIMVDRITLSGNAIGYIYALAGGVGWSLGTIAFKRWQPLPSLTWVTALQALYGAPALIFLAAVFERDRSFPLTWGAGGALLFTGLGSSGIAYLLWFFLLRRGAASVVSAYVFLVPLGAVLSGALLLGESLVMMTALGATALVIGIFLVNQTSRSGGSGTVGTTPRVRSIDPSPPPGEDARLVR